MAIDAELARIGASRLSPSGFPVVTAVNPVGSEDTDAESFGEIDLLSSLGISSRPAPATRGADGKVTGYAEALVCRGVPGTNGVAINVRDERASDAYAMLNEGDSCLHATGTKHGAMVFAREDGRVTMLTSEDATTAGRTVFIEASPDGQRFVGPWGKVTFGQDGFHVRHYTGARLDMGGIGGLPAPLDALGTYFAVEAASLNLKAPIIQLGADGVPDPVARSTQLVVALTSLNATLLALAGALQTIVNAPLPNPSATSTAATIGTALGVTAGLLTAAIIDLPSKSTTVT